MALSKNFIEYTKKLDVLFKEFSNSKASKKKTIVKKLFSNILKLKNKGLISGIELAYFVTGMIWMFDEVGKQENNFYEERILEYSSPLEIHPSKTLSNPIETENRLIEGIEEYLATF